MTDKKIKVGSYAVLVDGDLACVFRIPSTKTKEEMYPAVCKAVEEHLALDGAELNVENVEYDEHAEDFLFTVVVLEEGRDVADDYVVTLDRTFIIQID